MAENQRARVFGAVVASVAQVGYAATGVNEISEISGVSTRSIYNRFPGGKEEVFLAVLEEILDGTTAALSGAGENDGDWVGRLRAIYERFAEIVASQPAAASLVLIEAYAAGPAALAALDRATRTFERLSRKVLEESPERTGIPAAMVEAQVGALQELARTRLRRGEGDVMPALVHELVELVAGYRPPPTRLRLGNRRPALAADGIASSEEAERAIRGLTLAVAEHGYAGATIRQIARAGSMAVDTFYANFPDKRTALLAAIDSACSQLQANAMSAYRRSPGWSTGVRAAIGSALGFLAARPATANLLLAEIYAGGPEALRVRADGLGELAAVFAERAHQEPEVPPIAPEAILGSILALARRRLLRKGAESLPSLAPVATYVALAPYVGADEAVRVANGDARPALSKGRAAPPPMIPVRQTKWVINAMLASRWASAEEIAEQIGASLEQVTADLEELEREGLAERVTPVDDSRSIEWTNTRRVRLMDGEEWAALTPEERRGLTEDAVRVSLSHVAEALRQGLLGRRLDEQETILMLDVDEEGWRELSEIHRSTFNATQAVRAASRRRLETSGGRVVSARSLQMLFELPDQE